MHARRTALVGWWRAIWIVVFESHPTIKVTILCEKVALLGACGLPTCLETEYSGLSCPGTWTARTAAITGIRR